MSVNNQVENVAANLSVVDHADAQSVKSPAMSDSKAGYKIYAATTPEEIKRWRAFWMEQNRHPDADVDFYSLFVSLHAESMKPYILVATQNDQPKAMLIGRSENASVPIKLGYRTLLKLNLRQLIFLQDGYFGESNPEIARAMAAHLKLELKAGTADRAYIANIEITLDLYTEARRAPGFLLRDYSRKTAERWKTKLPANMEEFLKRRSKKHRYWLKRIGRVFEEAYEGKVTYKTCEKREEIASFCDNAELIAQTTYQRGLGVGFLNTPETHRRMELAADKGWLKGYMVFVGDEAVAFWCGRLYGGVMCLDWTGYKPAFRKFELGTVLFLRMLEDLCKCGTNEVDYGTGTAGYKERFGDHKAIEGFVSMYAPTIKGVGVNMLTTMDAVVNTTAKKLVSKLGIIGWVKKRWRGKLAGGTEKTVEKPAEQGAEAAESSKD